MKRATLMAFLLAFLAPIMSAWGHSTHYGKIKVVTQTGQGLVYVATTDTATSGNTEDTWDCSGDSSGDSKTFYIYAKATSDDWEFAGWTDNSSSGTPANPTSPRKVTPKASSTTSGSPTLTTYYAHFKSTLRDPFDITFVPGNYTVDGVAVGSVNADDFKGLRKVKSITLSSTDASFLNWTINGSTINANPYTANYEVDTTISANFLSADQVTTATTYDELAAALANAQYLKITIPSGKEIVVAKGTTLTVPAGKQLVVDGTLYVDGSLSIVGIVSGAGKLSKCFRHYVQTGENGASGPTANPFAPYPKEGSPYNIKYWVTKGSTPSSSVAVSGSGSNGMTVLNHVTFINGRGEEIRNTPVSSTSSLTILTYNVNSSVAMNHVTSFRSSYDTPANAYTAVATAFKVLTADTTYVGEASSKYSHSWGTTDCAGYTLTLSSELGGGSGFKFINGSITISGKVQATDCWVIKCSKFQAKSYHTDKTKDQAFRFFDTDSSGIDIAASMATGGDGAVFYSGTYDFSFSGKSNWKVYGGVYKNDPTDFLAQGLNLVATRSSDHNNYYLVYTYIPQKVVQVGDDAENQYEKLQDAINAATDGQTIKLITNFTLNETITIAAGKSVTINLNGYGITNSIGSITVGNNGALRIGNFAGDDGVCAATIVNNGSLDITYGTYSGTITLNDGMFTVHNGNFTGTLATGSGVSDPTTVIALKGGRFKNSVEAFLGADYDQVLRSGMYQVEKFPYAIKTAGSLSGAEKSWSLTSMTSSDRSIWLTQSKARSAFSSDADWDRYAELDSSLSPYIDYTIDCVLTFDRAVGNGSVKAYANAKVNINEVLDRNLAANEEYRVLTTKIATLGSGWYQINFNRFLKGDDCPTTVSAGVADVNEANVGTVATLELQLCHSNRTTHVFNKDYAVATCRYMLDGKKAAIDRGTSRLAYDSLAAAVAAAQDGETVLVGADTAENVTLDKAGTFTIDPYGFNWTGNAVAGEGSFFKPQAEVDSLAVAQGVLSAKATTYVVARKVAAVGTQFYDNLTEAVGAANGAVVTLLAETDETITLTAEGQSFTLNKNGVAFDDAKVVTSEEGCSVVAKATDDGTLYKVIRAVVEDANGNSYATIDEAIAQTEGNKVDVTVTAPVNQEVEVPQGKTVTVTIPGNVEATVEVKPAAGSFLVTEKTTDENNNTKTTYEAKQITEVAEEITTATASNIRVEEVSAAGETNAVTTAETIVETVNALMSNKALERADNTAKTDVLKEISVVPSAIVRVVDNDNNAVVRSAAFDVTPKDVNGDKVTTGDAFTFRLPVDAAVAVNGKAIVRHEGTFFGLATIQVWNNHNFIEVTSSNFSEYSYEILDGETANPVAAIGTTGYATFADAIAAAEAYKTANGAYPQIVVLDEAAALDNAMWKIDSGSLVRRYFYQDADDATLWHVENLDGLKEFRDSVNNGTSYAGKTIQLDNPVDLADENWTPIGSDVNKFSGVFDGNGKIVSNLTINDSTLNNAGLFGYANKATFKNVKFENVSITANNWAGALVGQTRTTPVVVENCSVTGTINISGNHYVGGLAGQLYGVNSVSGCSVDGGDATKSIIHAADHVANSGDGDDVGGITGFAEPGNIADCSVKNVTLEGFRQVGGIVGLTSYGTITGATVEDVVVKCIADENTVATQNKKMGFGGVVGAIRSTTTALTIDDCTVSGVSLESNETGLSSARMGYITGGLYNTDTFDVPEGTKLSVTDVTVENCTRVAGTLLPTPSSTMPVDGYLTVAAIGTTGYTSLAAAIAIAQDGDTITLLADIELDSTVRLNKEGTYTIDGAGYAISMAAGADFGSDGAIGFGPAGGGLASDIATKNYTLKNTTFSGFDSEIIRCETASLAIEDCTFENNAVTKSPGGRGKNLVLFTSAAATVTGCTFTGNSGAGCINFNGQAGTNAGAGPLDVTDNLFSNNTLAGSGVIFSNGSAGTSDKIENNTFSGNTMTSGSAAVLYLSGTVDSVSGNLFKDNVVNASGTGKEGVLVLGSAAGGTAITENAFIGNTLSDSVPEYATVYVNDKYADYTFDVSGNYWGDGNAPETGTGNDIYRAGTGTMANTGYATTYTANENTNGATVNEIKTFVAQIVRGVEVVGKYESFAEALDEAQSGDTVQLLADVTDVAETISLDKELTIDGQGQYSITAAENTTPRNVIEAYSGARVMFDLNNGAANVTFKNITLDNGERHYYSFLVRAKNDGTATFDGATLLHGAEADMSGTDGVGYGAAVLADGGNVIVTGDFYADTHGAPVAEGEAGDRADGIFPFTAILYQSGNVQFANGTTANIGQDLLLVGMVGAVDVSDEEGKAEVQAMLGGMNIPEGFYPYTLKLGDIDLTSFTGASPLGWNDIIDYGKGIMEIASDAYGMGLDSDTTPVEVGLLAETTLPDEFTYEDSNFTVNGNGNALSGTIVYTDDAGTMENVVLGTGEAPLVLDMTGLSEGNSINLGSGIAATNVTIKVTEEQAATQGATIVTWQTEDGDAPLATEDVAVTIVDAQGEPVVDPDTQGPKEASLVWDTELGIGYIGPCEARLTGPTHDAPIYTTLAHAIELAAQSGDTVTLLMDVANVSGTYEISKQNLVIDGAGHTVTAAPVTEYRNMFEAWGGSRNMFKLKTGAITFRNITLDGDATHAYTFLISGDNSGVTLTTENVRLVNGGEQSVDSDGVTLTPGNGYGAAIRLNNGAHIVVSDGFYACTGGKTAGCFPFTAILVDEGGADVKFKLTENPNDPANVDIGDDLLLVGMLGDLISNYGIGTVQGMLDEMKVPSRFIPYTLTLADGSSYAFTGASPRRWNDIIDYGKDIMDVATTNGFNGLDKETTPVEVGLLADTVLPDTFVYEDSNFTVNGNGNALSGTIKYTDDAGVIKDIVLGTEEKPLVLDLREVTEPVEIGNLIGVTNVTVLMTTEQATLGQPVFTWNTATAGEPENADAVKITVMQDAQDEYDPDEEHQEKGLVWDDELGIAYIGPCEARLTGDGREPGYMDLTNAFSMAVDGDTVALFWSDVTLDDKVSLPAGELLFATNKYELVFGDNAAVAFTNVTTVFRSEIDVSGYIALDGDCASGYFVRRTVDNGTNVYVVVARNGEYTVTGKTEEGGVGTATIKVSDDWITENIRDFAAIKTINEIEDYLDSADATTGMRKWEDYVLRQTDSPFSVTSVDAANNSIATTLSDPEIVDTTGFSVAYSLDETDKNGAIRTPGQQFDGYTSFTVPVTSVESSAFYRVRAHLTSGGKTLVVDSTNTIGVLKVTNTYATAIIAVPWVSFGSDTVKVSELMRTDTLSANDELYAYDAATGKYKAWTLTSGKQWEPMSNISEAGISDGVEASAYTIARGSAVWLKRQGISQPIYLVGEATTKGVTTTLMAAAGTGDGKQSWNLVAPPTAEAFDLNTISKKGEFDRIVIPTAGAPKNYTYVNGHWGYYTTAPVVRNDVQVGVKSVFKTDDTRVPAGTGFFYLNSSGTEGAKIEW